MGRILAFRRSRNVALRRMWFQWNLRSVYVNPQPCHTCLQSTRFAHSPPISWAFAFCGIPTPLTSRFSSSLNRRARTAHTNTSERIAPMNSGTRATSTVEERKVNHEKRPAHHLNDTGTRFTNPWPSFRCVILSSAMRSRGCSPGLRRHHSTGQFLHVSFPPPFLDRQEM